ncbi:flavin reductase family protein [Corynebacterium halotolerans]|uniref:flavin reductase family protein n=1 Tax=Corynebacterium halotolerans TaxID=225326 RepID=UPI003CE86FB6
MTSPTLAPTALRSILAHAPTPITAVAARIEGELVGMIVGSFIGLSLEPPLVGLSIQKTSTTWPVLRTAEQIGITVLSENHRTIVRQIAGPAATRFTGLDLREEHGAVLLNEGSAQLRTHLVQEVDTGDHLLAILEIEDAAENPAASALVFHGSQIRGVQL